MKQSILLTIILLFILSPAYGQARKLSVNLPAAYHFNAESSVLLVVEQEFMGIRYSTKMEINTLVFMQVKGLDADSNYVLSASYQKMNIHVSSLLINMEVNTESLLPGDSLSHILHSIKGKEFGLILSRNHQISCITGLDKMITETVESSYLQGEQKTEFTRNLIQSLGEDVLLDNFSSYTSFYPDLPVKESDQWSYNNKIMKSGIPMEMNSRIKLKSISENLAIMASSGEISAQVPDGDKDLLPSIDMLSGKEVSEIKMDIKTGLILESIISQNVSGSIRTPAQVDKTKEVIIPFTIKSRNSINISPQK